MIHVAISGIDGELGQAIASRVESTPGMCVRGGITHAEQHNGRQSRLATVLDGADVLVDVTRPGDLMANAITCLALNCALVAGCGPLDPNHLAELREYSRHIPILHAPNLCLETAAMLSVLPVLQYSLSHLSAEVTGVDPYRRRRTLDADSQGLTEPIVFFSGGGQEIMLSQKVYSHEAPARGAVRAVNFLAQQEHGFFTMDDLLRPLPVDTGSMASTRVR